MTVVVRRETLGLLAGTNGRHKIVRGSNGDAVERLDRTNGTTRREVRLYYGPPADRRRASSPPARASKSNRLAATSSGSTPGRRWRRAEPTRSTSTTALSRRSVRRSMEDGIHDPARDRPAAAAPHRRRAALKTRLELPDPARPGGEARGRGETNPPVEGVHSRRAPGGPVLMTTATSYYLPTRLDLDELEAQHGGELTLEEARDVAAALGAMARGHQWWIGDLLVWGEVRFGEEFAQLEAELDLPPQTAANWRWVAASVKPSRRREKLTWSHHAEVARLPAKVQDALLRRAEKDSWTVRELREHVAANYPADQQSALAINGPEPSALDDRDTQRRLEDIEQRLQAGDGVTFGMLQPGDVVWLLGLAKRLTRGGS